MNLDNKKKIVNTLNKTFLKAGEIAIELRKKGLIKEIKSDNTPVTNGDIEVNNILTKKIKQNINNKVLQPNKPEAEIYEVGKNKLKNPTIFVVENFQR